VKVSQLKISQTLPSRLEFRRIWTSVRRSSIIKGLALKIRIKHGRSISKIVVFIKTMLNTTRTYINAKEWTAKRKERLYPS